MEGLPIIPSSVMEFAKDAQALSQKITTAGELAARVLPGVEAGLTTADMGKLQASTWQVANLTKALQAMVPAGVK